MRAVIACRTLGPIEVTVDGAPAGPELLWRKHLALLIYLARSAPRARTREHLVGLLWPDKPEAKARHSLTEAVRVLRRHGGEDCVLAKGGQLRLGDGRVSLDLERLTAHADRGEWADAARLVAGEFLEGFCIPGASEFEDWLAAERSHWRAQSVAVLIQQADELERKGNAPAGAAHALRALALDPRSERAIRSAMRCLALAGDRMHALHLYEDFRARMAAEIAAQPDRETAALSERIRRERGAPAPPASGPSSTGLDLRSPMVARDEELIRLQNAAAESFRERRAGALVIEGDGGYGKSRLIEELTARLRLQGITVVLARAVEADRTSVCGGVLALAQGGLLDAPGMIAAPPRAVAALARMLPAWEARAPEAAEGEPLALARAFGEVLRASAEEHPLALVVDDAHWLDRDTALLLGGLLRDLDALPFLVVLAVHPRWPRPELDEIRSRIGRDLSGAAISLAPLGRGGLTQLARHYLPSYTEVELDRVIRRVSTDSAGVPFLAVELFKAVALGLDLGAVSPAWPEPLRTMDQSLPGGVPDAIVAAIRITFRQLGPQARSALLAAAVIGDPAQPADIGRAAGLGSAELAEALDELEWHRWVVVDPRGYGVGTRLTHEVLVRDMVTPGQRARLLAALG